MARQEKGRDSMTGSINFDADTVAKLQRAYAHAVETKQEQFLFEGHELVTLYAKYLLEYLKPKFGIS